MKANQLSSSHCMRALLYFYGWLPYNIK